MSKEAKQLSVAVMKAIKTVKQNNVAFFEVPLEDRQWTAGTHAAFLARLAGQVFADTKDADSCELNRQVFRDILQGTTTITEQSNFKKKLIELGYLPAADKKPLSDD